MSQPEPRNPFYPLLLLASLVFVVTALAVAVVPVLEQKAREAGQPPPPSAFRDALREEGWQWLLYEVSAMIVFGLACMGLDRLRTLKKTQPPTTIPPSQEHHPSS
jgi:type II secretory pathway component PulF